MAKKLETKEIEDMAFELARNRHFIERIDDYEKQAIKNFIEHPILLHDLEVRIGLKNIPQERIDTIRNYKRAKLVLNMDAIKKVFGDDLETHSTIGNGNKLDSNPVLGKLLALDAPETTGVPAVTAWLEELGYDRERAAEKATAVYNTLTATKGLTKDKSMLESTVHLEKLLEYIYVNPKFKKHEPEVKRYLKTATETKKTKNRRPTK